jgi:hypothetical protein
MEAVTLAGLVGLGYLVARTAGPSTNTKAVPATTTAKAGANYPNAPGAPRRAYENFENPRDLPPGSVLMNTPKGASATGAPAELDLMFQTPNGRTYPSEPYPGPYGMPIGYASQKPPIAARAPPNASPAPQPIEAVAPSIAMNPAGVEQNPNYANTMGGPQGEYVVSQLSGERMPSKDFKHSNMVPFFGGRIKQNVAVDTNISILDSYTGAGSTDIRKKEVETMFNTSQTPFGNPFGMEDNTDFFQSRMDDPALRRRDGERPFEPERVGPAVKEKFGMTGKGGFQQLEVNEIMMRAMPTSDKLRVADNPKMTYKTPVVPGQRFSPAGPNNPGEVRKYKPDAFYIDETGERYIGAFAEEAQRETTRPVQVYKFVARPETSSEFIGPAASQEFGESYTSGEYRSPMAQQFGGAGFRNADMQTYYTNDVDQPEADYGRSSIEIRPNERLATQDRVMGLNLAPADNVQVPVHFTDESRPTRRGETVGNIRQTGTPTGYAGSSAPAITVWDPSDVARTTVKETTIEWGNLGLGIASSGDMPTKLKAYDPDDIARPTQKAQLSAKLEWYGPGSATRKDFTSHEAAYNMRLNPNKEAISKGRKPFAGNGQIAVAQGDPGSQTSKKLDADMINDRELQINAVSGLPPGAGDLGAVKYRLPLKLDVSLERNQPAIVSAVENNPLQQSLQRNAQHDQLLLEQLYQKVGTTY